MEKKILFLAHVIYFGRGAKHVLISILFLCKDVLNESDQPHRGYDSSHVFSAQEFYKGFPSEIWF